MRCRSSWACSTRSTTCGGSSAGCAMRWLPNRPRSALPSSARCRAHLTPRAIDAGLQRPKPRSGAALDGGGDQRLEVEAIAQELEYPQLLLARLAVGGDEITGDGVGGLPQLCGEGRFDHLQNLLEPILPADQLGAVLQYSRQLALVEVTENREVADD